LASDNARTSAVAMDDHAVSNAQRRVGELRDSDRRSVVEAHEDLLAGATIGVTVLHGVAGETAADDTEHGCHIAAAAGADLMTQDAACRSACDGANAKLVVAFEFDRLDPADDAVAHGLLTGRRAATADRARAGGK
ncbi:MAG TPA: hypothetical protein VEN28_16795, partial [Burkholderiaceae bacterium]|nr:hypothetical protein [Burkholderiaceae bacterium]